MRRSAIAASMAVLLAGAALAGCASTTSTTSTTASSASAAATSTPASKSADAGAATPAAPVERALPGGLKVTDLKIGDGAIAENGMICQVQYTGWLLDGTEFDSSKGGEPLQFRLGGGQVIRGLEEGIKGMRVGGKRLLVVPSDMAYGERGTPGGPIPPNAALKFEVELVGLR